MDKCVFKILSGTKIVIKKADAYPQSSDMLILP